MNQEYHVHISGGPADYDVYSGKRTDIRNAALHFMGNTVDEEFAGVVLGMMIELLHQRSDLRSYDVVSIETVMTWSADHNVASEAVNFLVKQRVLDMYRARDGDAVLTEYGADTAWMCKKCMLDGADGIKGSNTKHLKKFLGFLEELARV